MQHSIDTLKWINLLYCEIFAKILKHDKKAYEIWFFAEKQVPRSIKIQYNGEVYLNILELRENINIFQGSFPECNFIVQRFLT